MYNVHQVMYNVHRNKINFINLYAGILYNFFSYVIVMTYLQVIRK